MCYRAEPSPPPVHRRIAGPRRDGGAAAGARYPTDMTTAESIVAGDHMVRGSLWSIGLRWSLRLTGVASTVILARVLAPEDFGVMAMALLVAGAIEVLSDTGQSLALIRHPNPTREHFDSAWTMSILISLCIAIAIYVAAPLSVWYFHEPRAITVIQCLALRAFIGGFENVGIVTFRKELNFSRHFQYLVYQKLISFVVSIGLALLIRNYWALAISVVSTRLIGVVLSYRLQPFRPRLSLTKVRELWSFSIWLLIRHIGTWASMRLDEIAVGGIAGAGSMGRYNVASDVSMSPTQEIADPILATLFPVVATIQHDPIQVRELYKRVLYWLCLISASTSVGVALIANDIVVVVLGPRWADIAPLMIWLALTSGIMGMTDNIFVMLDVIGRPQLSARLQWMRLLILGAVLLPAARTGSLEFIAICRLAVSGLMAPVLFIAISRELPVPLTELWSAIWRPLIAALFMAGAVRAANGALLDDPIIVRLALEIILGALCYAAGVFLLWWASGRPRGAERTVIDTIHRLLALWATRGAAMRDTQATGPPATAAMRSAAEDALAVAPAHHQLQQLLRLINPSARLPTRVFPTLRPPARVRALQLTFGYLQILHHLLRLRRCVLISGRHLTTVSGEIALDTTAILPRALSALARKQAVIIVPARRIPALRDLCDALRIDPCDHIDSYLNSNPHLVVLARRNRQAIALHYSIGQTGMAAVRQHHLGLQIAKPVFTRLGFGRLIAEPIEIETDDHSATLIQERLPGRTERVQALSEVQFNQRIALALEPLFALHAGASAEPLGPDHDLIFVALPRLLARLPEYADQLAGPIAALQSWRGRLKLGAVLTHGDFWLQNVLFEGEPLRLTGIIDWEWHRTGGCAGFDAVQLGVISFAYWMNVPLHELLCDIVAGRCRSTFIADHLAVVKTRFDLDDDDIAYLVVLSWLTRLFNVTFNRMTLDRRQLRTVVEYPARELAPWLAQRASSGGQR
jgi:lipopolysaccharide exporter